MKQHLARLDLHSIEYLEREAHCFGHGQPIFSTIAALVPVATGGMCCTVRFLILPALILVLHSRTALAEPNAVHDARSNLMDLRERLRDEYPRPYKPVSEPEEVHMAQRASELSPKLASVQSAASQDYMAHAGMGARTCEEGDRRTAPELRPWIMLRRQSGSASHFEEELHVLRPMRIAAVHLEDRAPGEPPCDVDPALRGMRISLAADGGPGAPGERPGAQAMEDGRQLRAYGPRHVPASGVEDRVRPWGTSVPVGARLRILPDRYDIAADDEHDAAEEACSSPRGARPTCRRRCACTACMRSSGWPTSPRRR